MKASDEAGPAPALALDREAVSPARSNVPESAVIKGLRHLVLFYRDEGEYQAVLAQHVDAAAGRGEAVLILIPQPRLVQSAWAASPPGVSSADMTELGRNPARVVPALRSFCDANPHRRVLIIAEWMWPGRSHAELCEAARHEALLEHALDGRDVTVLCPYSATALPPWVLADAGCLHQWQAQPDTVRPSPTYAGPGSVPASCLAPLPSPPADAEAIEYRSDLRPVRAMVTAVAQEAGLSPNRATDLMLAASEVAANTLRHTRASGIALTWRTDREVLCQLSDSGYIADRLAGLRRPPAGESGGQGLWLVNQVCDLVELRSTQAGTLIRLHMRIGQP
jgi:anti-sigma regulatory factor (Ser/Thr protein kinase)